MDLKIDKEFESLFPRMGKTQFEALKQEILAYNGLREPIDVTPEGVILDGHNRYQALAELKRLDLLRTNTMTFPDRAAMLDYIYAKNSRRESSDYGKAKSAYKYIELKKTQPSHEGRREKTIEEAAKIQGLSKATLERALAIIRSVEKRIKELCETETLTIGEGYQLVKALKNTPKEAKEGLLRKLVAGKISARGIVKALTITDYIKALLEGETEEVLKEANKLFEDKFYTEELDPTEAKWQIEEIAGDSHETKRGIKPASEVGQTQEEANEWFNAHGGRCIGEVKAWEGEWDKVGEKLNTKTSEEGAESMKDKKALKKSIPK